MARPPKATKTMDDIARLAQVSKPTVSRALNDSPLISPSTKKRILEVARRHGYTVNRNAQKLWGRRTNTIAVVCDFGSLPGHRLTDPFHFELLANIANALNVRGQDLLLCSQKADEHHVYQALLSSKGADGVIFIGQGGRQAALRELAKTRSPFVVWGAAVDDANYCTVGSDNFRGGWLIGKRFAELGRRRILFIGPRGHPEIQVRRSGLAAALAEHGTKAEITDLVPSDLSFKSAVEAMRRHLTSKAQADAVFGASDTIAMGVIAALRETDLGVTTDVSVVGYDDGPFAQYHQPPLTTIRQDTSLGGALLVEKLIQLLEGGRPKSATLPTELIVRAT